MRCEGSSRIFCKIHYRAFASPTGPKNAIGRCTLTYSYPAYWSASSREPLRSTIGIAEVRTAIEYEYRFTEYRPPRRTEYEYDGIRCDARTIDLIGFDRHSDRAKRSAWNCSLETDRAAESLDHVAG